MKPSKIVIASIIGAVVGIAMTLYDVSCIVATWSEYHSYITLYPVKIDIAIDGFGLLVFSILLVYSVRCVRNGALKVNQ